jgi:hypothetical protein
MEKEQEIRNKFFDKIEKLKRTSLSIQRIPEKTKTEFMELAEKEFCKDYGMTIKWLLDFRKGLLENPNSQLQAQINLLAEEIAELKKEEKIEEQPKGIKRADGQTR